MLTILPAFNDLKKKSKGGGGFSDGGVHCERHTLSSTPVEAGPPPGVAWGGFSASNTPFNPSSVQAINFDPAVSVTVEEYLVFEDGTQQKTGEVTCTPNISTTDPTLNDGAVQSCSPYLSAGGILAYPNKLRYKLVTAVSEQALPAGRVLLHFDVSEFDVPSDQQI